MTKPILLRWSAVAALIMTCPAIASSGQSMQSSTAVSARANTAAANSVAASRDRWDGAPRSLTGREAWLDRRIRIELANGQLDERQAHIALREMADIKRIDAYYRSRNGYALNDGQRSEIQARLDAVAAKLP